MQCLQLTRGDPPAASMKWYFNQTITLPEKGTTWTIDFVLGNLTTNYFELSIILDESDVLLLRGKTRVNMGGFMGSRFVDFYSDKNGWIKSGYRTITFTTPPTGTLLSWLKANAIPQ